MEGPSAIRLLGKVRGHTSWGPPCVHRSSPWQALIFDSPCPAHILLKGVVKEGFWLSLHLSSAQNRKYVQVPNSDVPIVYMWRLNQHNLASDGWAALHREAASVWVV